MTGVCGPFPAAGWRIFDLHSGSGGGKGIRKAGYAGWVSRHSPVCAAGGRLFLMRVWIRDGG